MQEGDTGCGDGETCRVGWRIEEGCRVKGEGLGRAKGWGNYDKIRTCTIKKDSKSFQRREEEEGDGKKKG